MAAILVLFCLLANEPLFPRLRENILLNFKFKNEATRANLLVNKRILNWRHVGIRCMYLVSHMTAVVSFLVASNE